jgi:hypothetical protein
MGENMKTETQKQATRPLHTDAALEGRIADLEHAPTGAPLTNGDKAFLVGAGLVLPVVILIWGWM